MSSLIYRALLAISIQKMTYICINIVVHSLLERKKRLIICGQNDTSGHSALLHSELGRAFIVWNVQTRRLRKSDPPSTVAELSTRANSGLFYRKSFDIKCNANLHIWNVMPKYFSKDWSLNSQLTFSISQKLVKRSVKRTLNAILSPRTKDTW